MKDQKLMALMANNPAIILLLAAVPALAGAADVQSALVVGLFALVLLLGLTLLSLLLRGVLVSSFRLPVFTLLAVAVCSAGQMWIHAALPQVYNTLGIYLILLALSVSFFAVSQAEAGVVFTSGMLNAVKAAILFILAAVLTAAICEVFGSGSFFGNEVAWAADYKNAVLVQPAGKILIYGLVTALLSPLFKGKKEEAK